MNDGEPMFPSLSLETACGTVEEPIEISDVRSSDSDLSISECDSEECPQELREEHRIDHHEGSSEEQSHADHE